MTYCKTGTEFPDDAAAVSLSDAAYRTHHEAITWVYRVEELTLRVPKHLVRRFAGSDEHETAVKDLVAGGWWDDDGDAWLIRHHDDVVRSGIVSQQKFRDRTKRNQRAYRARQSSTNVGANVSDDASDDVSDNAVSQSDIPKPQETSASVTTAAKGRENDKLCSRCNWPLDGTMHRRVCEAA